MIIAAAAARPYIRAAAAAGYEVVAVDVFGDVDTETHASQLVSLPYAHGGFDAEAFRRQVFPLLAVADTAFVYGSGFETQPELLDEIAQRCPILGNDAETVRITKHPDRFFSLLAALDIPIPKFSLIRTAASKGWLSKAFGGSGGTHVRVDSSESGDTCYYQQPLPGAPCSLLFLADGQQTQPIGFNRLLLAPTIEMPFRYGGAVSQIVLSDAVHAGMLQAARKMTAALGLRGLNSLDCMVDGDRFWVLEVNPRLSATFALYDAATHGALLLQSHLMACSGERAPALPPEQAHAHLIYYAPKDIKIPAGMTWPAWVADIPPGGSTVRADEPLCSVLAAHDDPDAAYALAQARVAQLSKQIN